MLVTVIIPVYNCEAYLGECLDSVLAQTHDEIEVIVVDDGSTDSSGAICERYAARDSRVRVLHKPHSGPASRNAGIDVASGPYVTFVDADDILHPTFIEVLLSLMRDSSSAAAICEFTRKKRWRGLRKDRKYKIRYYNAEEAIRRSLYQNGLTCSLCGKLLPTYAVKDARQREGLLYEDLDSFYRIYENVQGLIASTRARLYYYRRTPGSIINSFTPKRLDVLGVTDRICSHYAGNAMLAPAARDRRFSANFNMFLLCWLNNMRDQADLCWCIIKEGRREALTDKHVRLKNKIGALLSFLGKRSTAAIFRILRNLHV